VTEIKPGTPLPWVAHPEMAWVTSAHAPNDAPVCALCVESYGVNREPEAEANARYIVTACNAYPSLLAALKEAREALAGITPTQHIGEDEQHRAFYSAARAALAKLDTLLSQESQS